MGRVHTVCGALVSRVRPCRAYAIGIALDAGFLGDTRAITDFLKKFSQYNHISRASQPWRVGVSRVLQRARTPRTAESEDSVSPHSAFAHPTETRHPAQRLYLPSIHLVTCESDWNLTSTAYRPGEAAERYEIGLEP